MASAPFRSIATLLIQRIIWLALACLLVLGSLHAWIQLRHDERSFERAVHTWAESSKRALATALWDIEPQVVQQQVQWIAALPEVAYVQVSGTQTNEQFVAGAAKPQSVPTIALPLMSPRAENMQLGVLEVWTDSSYFVHQLLQSLLRLVLGYALFTCLICMMVAWVMRRELRQPLSQIARFAAALKPNQLAVPLQLQRPQRQQPDEIDLVIQGFHHLQEDLRRYIDNLDELVADRTQKLEMLVEEVKRLSHLDALTGAYNRRAMEGRLPLDMERAERYGRPLAVVFVDIDHFKRINDQHGHGVGDEVLKEVAHRLHASLRTNLDWMVRFGGEEFVIFMPETDAPQAAEAAQRLAQQVRQSPWVGADGCKLALTCSFGVAQYRTGDSMDALLARADEQLYMAKRGGRDRVCVSP